MFLFGVQYLNKWKAQHDEKQLYQKNKPYLLFNSSLNYDFRMQSKFNSLLNTSSSTVLSSLVGFKNPEADRLKVQSSHAQLDDDFRNFAENFLLFCGDDHEVRTQENIITSS